MFNYGWYWPVILSLGFTSKKSYWFGFFIGILVSAVTKTNLGLASLLIVAALFIFDRLREQMRSNTWLVGLAAVIFGLVADKLMGTNWSFFEGVTVFLLSRLLYRLDFFNDDLHLSSR